MKVYNERARILVVDDEPAICRALTIAFSRAGYHVRAVESGEVALSLLRTEHFDSLIVDLRVPDMRGDVLFELAAALQPQLRANTIFTTGDASEFAQDLIGACGCPLIAKPFELSEMLKRVESLLRGSRRGARA